MPFISTNTWVLKIIDGTLSHRMKALGGYALYDEAFAGAREETTSTVRAASAIRRNSARNSARDSLMRNSSAQFSDATTVRRS